MTNRPESLESSVMRSSVMPSAKYSCFGSSLMLAKGNTAMEGRSDGIGGTVVLGDGGPVSSCQGCVHASAPAIRASTTTAAADGQRQDGALAFATTVLPACAESCSTR